LAEKRVRLQATDVEDLAVIAAFLQDARTCVAEMAYDPQAQRFMVAFIRYRRETYHDATRCEGLTECSAALVIDDVLKVRYRGIDETARLAELNLLTIATEPAPGTDLFIDLVFAGEGTIRLQTPSTRARLDDFSDPVPCQISPCNHFTAA
jgi:Protein of unknown function (DUF2948)